VTVGVRSLFLLCLPAAEPQFRGILRAAAELGRRERCATLHWQGEALELARRRVLAQVLVAGHGLQGRAGLAPRAPGLPALDPSRLALPAPCTLYLLACFQGRAPLRESWANGAGVSPGNVHGSDGETESALSTCLLLHLLEQGPESLERWFPAWQRANDALRPHFPRIRRSYRKHGGDPLATLQELYSLVRQTGSEAFVSVIRRHPQYLTGLL